MQLVNDALISDDDFLIDVNYHRCYQICTLASSQERDGQTEPETRDNRHRLTRSGADAFDTTKCIFRNCYKNKGDPTLYQVRIVVTDERNKRVAVDLQDDNQDAQAV